MVQFVRPAISVEFCLEWAEREIIEAGMANRSSAFQARRSRREAVKAFIIEGYDKWFLLRVAGISRKQHEIQLFVKLYMW